MIKNIFPFVSKKANMYAIISDWTSYNLNEAQKLKLFCEIEIRHGNFIPTCPKPKTTWATLKESSLQSLLIIRTNSK
jgi:hypothetical protein